MSRHFEITEDNPELIAIRDRIQEHGYFSSIYIVSEGPSVFFSESRQKTIENLWERIGNTGQVYFREEKWRVLLDNLFRIDIYDNIDDVIERVIRHICTPSFTELVRIKDDDPNLRAMQAELLALGHNASIKDSVEGAWLYFTTSKSAEATHPTSYHECSIHFRPYDGVWGIGFHEDNQSVICYSPEDTWQSILNYLARKSQ